MDPQDIDKADRIAREIDAGVVTVNNVVASDPRMPFGGVKKSGFDRELSRYGHARVRKHKVHKILR